eukprot:2109870-Lingulodinium_polyedra.AAC.1
MLARPGPLKNPWARAGRKRGRGRNPLPPLPRTDCARRALHLDCLLHPTRTGRLNPSAGHTPAQKN